MLVGMRLEYGIKLAPKWDKGGSLLRENFVCTFTDKSVACTFVLTSKAPEKGDRFVVVEKPAFDTLEAFTAYSGPRYRDLSSDEIAEAAQLASAA